MHGLNVLIIFLRNLLVRSARVRKIRARLLYSVKNWKPRVMAYWQWNNAHAHGLDHYICGPSATREKIEYSRGSIVWLAVPRSDDICLNIGCGIGRVEKFLAAQVKEIHAVDFSETMLAAARIRLAELSNVFLYRNDGESLNMFADASFSLAWAEMVFQHVPIEITENYLNGVARVLKPHGRFICQLPRKESYELQSRDICGWMTLPEAERLMQKHFHAFSVWQDAHHIYALGFKGSGD
jgi:SAM-dependent methyltransferase